MFVLLSKSTSTDQFVDVLYRLVAQASPLLFDFINSDEGVDGDFLFQFINRIRSDRPNLSLADKSNDNVLDRAVRYFGTILNAEGVDRNHANYFVFLIRALIDYGAPLESRDSNGRTVLLRLANTHVEPSIICSLLHRSTVCDVSAADKDGRNMFHLVQHLESSRHLQYLLRPPDPNFSVITHSLGILFEKDKDGLTPVELAANNDHNNGDEKVKTHRLMDAAAAEWKNHVVPVLVSELEDVIGVKDLAIMCQKYIDGSGGPWDTKEVPRQIE